MGSTEENNNMEIEKDDTAKSAFKSTWSKYRAVKECLPKTPQKRASTISQLATSPACRGILEEEGPVVTPQVRKKNTNWRTFVVVIEGIVKGDKRTSK